MKYRLLLLPFALAACSQAPQASGPAASGTVMATYGVSATPTFYVIGKDGTIASPPLTGEITSEALMGVISAAGGTT